MKGVDAWGELFFTIQTIQDQFLLLRFVILAINKFIRRKEETVQYMVGNIRKKVEPRCEKTIDVIVTIVKTHKRVFLEERTVTFLEKYLQLFGFNAPTG